MVKAIEFEADILLTPEASPSWYALHQSFVSVRQKSGL